MYRQKNKTVFVKFGKPLSFKTFGKDKNHQEWAKWVKDKVYALAGLRIGFGISHPDIADLLNRVRQPFNTNLIAQAAALAALDDDDHIQASIRMNNEGKSYLQGEFDRLGLEYLPSMGNFLTVNMKQDAGPVYQALLHQGVIVRPVANYQMPNYLRITIGTPEQNSRLIDALARALS